MAGFDFNLGDVHANIPPGSLSLTTSHAASANTRVVALVSYWASTSVERSTGLTIGGTAATRDLQVLNSNAQDTFEVWSLPVAAGLASGSTITVTFGGSNIGGVLMGALSLSSVDMTNGGGVAGVGSSSSQSGTSWTSGTASAAGGIAVGGAGNESGSPGSIGGTMVTGTKVHDNWDSTAAQGFQTAYIVGGTSVAGSFGSTATITVGGIVAYAGSGVAQAISTANLTTPMHARYR